MVGGIVEQDEETMTQCSNRGSVGKENHSMEIVLYASYPSQVGQRENTSK